MFWSYFVFFVLGGVGVYHHRLLSSDDFSDDQVATRLRELADKYTILNPLDVVAHLKISLTLAQEFLLVRGRGGNHICAGPLRFD